MNIHSTTGIVLKLTKLTETSLIVTWFTADFGKLKTVAKGARRPKNPFLGKLDLFYHDDLVFVHSRRSELHILKECTLTAAFPKLREDFTRMARASYFCELVDQTTEVETPVSGLFEALKRGLGELDEGGTAKSRTGESGVAGGDTSVRRFELALFEALGHAPRLVECARCARAVAGDAFFGARVGGALCPRCASGVSPKFKIDSATLRALHALAARGGANVALSATQRSQCDQVASAMLKEVLGVWPKSRQFLGH